MDVSWSCNRTTGNATYYFSRHTIVFPCIFLLGGCGYLTHISSVFWLITLVRFTGKDTFGITVFSGQSIYDERSLKHSHRGGTFA